MFGTRYLSGSITLLFLFFVQFSFSQTGSIEGIVRSNGKPLAAASLILEGTLLQTIADENGKFKIPDVPAGIYQLAVTCVGCKIVRKEIHVLTNQTAKVDFALENSFTMLSNVVISSDNDKSIGVKHLKSVDDGGIYAGKKNEVIDLNDVVGNKAANASRQIFSKISGLNIWESDGAGIQLGIGGRGLNPNRVANFNTRQNGYDMSADALGYPESYYTPSAEAIDRIEIVRGAASLQYGTQFGGVVNFKLKKGNPEKPFEVESRQTFGSFGFFNTFNSIGGTKNKISYYTFYQHKQGNGWRENSAFNVDNAYGRIDFRLSEKFNISAEYTFMNYMAQQPGGLTDNQFKDDPRKSIRDRNWFKVNWNLGAVVTNYNLSDKFKFNNRLFGLLAGRSALGMLDPPNKIDFLGDRQLLVDMYKNWGDELRMMYHYTTRNNPSVLLVGARYYKGLTERTQGMANDRVTGYKSDFAFTNIDKSEYSEYSFPGQNIAVFAENIFQLSPKWNVTPGVRYENILMEANGYYNLINRDLAGNIIYKEKINENQLNSRSFLLTGLGTSYKPNDKLECYANISQNYRSITYSEMRIANPNVRVDQHLKDEKGYTADAGIRGTVSEIFNYDLSAFIIHYNDRIGSVIKNDPVTFNTYRFRTNIADSRNLGVETFAELDILKLIKRDAAARFSVFSNFSMIEAKYINSKETAIDNKNVEMVPNYILRSGITFKKKKFASTLQFSYVSEQFTDATNSVYTNNAVYGIVPAYYVMDIAVDYSYKIFAIAAGISNITNNIYFTRRADGYPGPGIIPSDGMNYFITLQVKF